jgi:hypothetical protein
VTPEFVSQMQEAGLITATPSLFEDFRIHGVTPEFAQAIQALDFVDFSPDKLVDMRIHGITADFVRKMKQADTSLTLSDLIDSYLSGEKVEFA